MLLRKLPLRCNVTTRWLSDESIIREFDPRANIKKTDILSNKGKDPTGYKIPFLEESEERLWNATTADQWSTKPKFGLIKGSITARQQKLYPDVVPTPIKHFNFGGSGELGAQIRKGLPMGSFGRTVLHGIQRDKPDEGLTKFTQSKGRTQASIIGKSLGSPINKDGFVDESFDSRLVLIDRKTEWFSSGKKHGFYAVVVVGNKNGLMGMAQAFSPERFPSMLKARDEAYQQLHYFERYNGHTVPYALAGQYNRTECHVIPHMCFGKNTGNFYVKYMLDLAGYKGVTVKTNGRNTRQMICKALITTLLSYETHQEQANRLGRHVVRFERQHNYRHNVLASPGPGAKIPVPITGEIAEVKGGPRPIKKGFESISENYNEQ